MTIRRLLGWTVLATAAMVFITAGGACTQKKAEEPGTSPVAAAAPEPTAAQESDAAPAPRAQASVLTPATDYPGVDGDWLILRMSDEPSILNPITSTDAYASEIEGMVFDSLLDRENDTLEIIPKLASRWEVSEDHLTYTFFLNEKAVFSDGAPVTAEDVKFTFDRIMDPAVDSAHLRNYFQDVTGCEAVDAHTLRFTCSKPYFKHLTMLGGLAVLPKHIYAEGDFNKHPNNRNPIGSGPYVFEKWDTGQQIVLARNEQYWGKKPHVLKRVYKLITDSNAAFQVLDRRELDTMSVTAEQWVGSAATPEFEAKFNKFQYYTAFYSYVGWNLRQPQFSDPLVRRALTMLLDRKTILETIYHGLGQMVSGNFFIDGPEYNKSIEPWPFDPEQAKQLLTQQGWVDGDNDGVREKDGVKFEFELMIRGGHPEGEAIATEFQNQLKQAGIGMTIRQLEWSAFIELVDARRFDAVILGWSGPIIESDPYQVWHSSQAEKGSNFVGFVNAEADQIMDQARLEFDEAKRYEMYHRFHAILHEEQPYTFLFCNAALVTVDKRFENVKVHPGGLDSREWFVPAGAQRYGK